MTSKKSEAREADGPTQAAPGANGRFQSGIIFAGQAAGTDPLYTDPYLDVDEWRDSPVRHRYVHGGFTGTEARFSMYFPPKEQYEGRFFQPLMAVSGNENTAAMAMGQSSFFGYAVDSGAYLVESNLGRRSMFPGDDPTIPAFRASAAVARYSRVLAAEMYGEHRPYGYVYGGSGGAFKTLSCVENTDVWDGSVPFVHGTPVNLPSAFTVQAHAMRVLKDKFPQIVDAIDPGGSGDIYAGLNIEEREALAEVTRMGFPPRAWFNISRIAFGYTGVFTVLVDHIVGGDPTYFEDFWKLPGYLGANPPESLKRARIQQDAIICGLVMPDEARKLGLPLAMPTSQVGSGVEFPAALRIAKLPEGNLQGASLILKSGAAKGHVLYIVAVIGDLVMVGFGAAHFKAMADIRAGDEVQIDNAIYLAAQTYHRHQLPSSEYRVWDQFRSWNGKPIYPQRPVQLGEHYARSGALPRQDGRFNGKMIVVETLMDEAAYPWAADWMRKRVEDALGSEYEDRYRLYFVDNAMHTAPTVTPNDRRPVATTRIINYAGVLQQALRDLSAWVEKGVAPPPSTNYEVVSGQVVVPASAAERRGIQPVVTVTANGKERADVSPGQEVEFSAMIDVPPGAGFVVAAKWDFEGAGAYPLSQSFDGAESSSSVTVKATHAFSKPGTYFPALRAIAHRQGDSKTRYARVQNIGRVRVVVA